MSNATRRLLVLGLDGFDPEVAARLIEQGRLPHLAHLQQQSQSFGLETGLEKYTGLAWEQFSSGLAPEQSQRFSATAIDVARYHADQPTTRLAPFTDGLDALTVVFDAPYFDLTRTSSAQGMVSWGSHDPGVPQLSSPDSLTNEILKDFGAYPAKEYIYGFVWPDVERTIAMGKAMVEAVKLRTRIVRWLLAERLPDWDLAITVISEYHSATEALWHGWDATHPLYEHPSAEAAREGFLAVYEAADELLGVVLEAFPDVALLAYTPHGMGRNYADVPAMLLLPELLYRRYTGRKGFLADPDWLPDGTIRPGAKLSDHWSPPILERLRIEQPFLDRLLNGRDQLQPDGMDWMPAALYRTAWRRMDAYASPAFYDGRVRVNLRGREARGRVAPSRYKAVLDDVATLLRECRDPRTGRPLDIEIEPRLDDDPLARNPTDADLIVRFSTDHYAFEHPKYGLMGPAPCRRPGGHSGGAGVAYLRDGSERSGDLGTFRTLEIPAGVRAWMGDESADGALARALRAAARS